MAAHAQVRRTGLICSGCGQPSPGALPGMNGRVFCSIARAWLPVVVDTPLARIWAEAGSLERRPSMEDIPDHVTAYAAGLRTGDLGWPEVAYLIQRMGMGRYAAEDLQLAAAAWAVARGTDLATLARTFRRIKDVGTTIGVKAEPPLRRRRRPR